MSSHAHRRRRVSAVVVAGGLLVVVGAIGFGAATALRGGGTSVDPAAAPPAGLRDEAETARRDPHGPGGAPAHEHPVENEAVLPPAAGTASLAGSPSGVARRFGSAWVNRASGPASLRALRERLVGLSTGIWAREVDAAIDAELAAGGGDAESEGAVLDTKTAGVFGGVIEVLVTTRERLVPGGASPQPYRYALYLARLEPADGGYAVSGWESQP
jgi:hypothetical protein